jgi:hypothetical protein
MHTRLHERQITIPLCVKSQKSADLVIIHFFYYFVRSDEIISTKIKNPMSASRLWWLHKPGLVHCQRVPCVLEALYRDTEMI